MRILDCTNTTPRAADILNRTWSSEEGIDKRVRGILESVRSSGDVAVVQFTREFDCAHIDEFGLRVTDSELEDAYGAVTRSFLKALRSAKENIMRFHKRQLLKSWTIRSAGSRLEQRVMPLERVGIYVPGGKAAYPSTVLMNALPARIAGVKEIVMTTPCNAEGRIAPEVLVAARECGVKEVYRIGGAQAIGALAFGTESIRKVDKITGPGNAYVAAAKKAVFGVVGIDMIAGPTEVVVVADETADVSFVAADLIAQAEHDEAATSICITTSSAFAQQLTAEVERQLAIAERREIAARSIADNGIIVIVKNLAHAALLVNDIAPEHLEVMVKQPRTFAQKIRNAGSIFVGTWATEAMGDYVVGTNHTLPTMGTARFSSPLSVYDFLKFTNVIELSRPRFASLAHAAEELAKAERLFGHAASISIRRSR